LWDDLLRNLQDAGGHLVKLRLEKPRFVSQNPASNNLERIYDPISIKGVIILRGAAKLEAMLRSNVPVLDYFRFLCSSPPVFLATPSSVEKGDRFIWQDKVYEIEEARQFFDGETLSYTLAKTPYSPRS
jgi:hypothetical protein